MAVRASCGLQVPNKSVAPGEAGGGEVEPGGEGVGCVFSKGSSLAPDVSGSIFFLQLVMTLLRITRNRSQVRRFETDRIIRCPLARGDRNIGSLGQLRLA